MNVERLQALSARLRHVPPENFSLKGWNTRDHGGTYCTACVAATMPEFNIVGYGGTYPVYNGKAGAYAFLEFFDLTHDQSWPLWIAEHDAPPNVIADRIDAMIAPEIAKRARLMPAIYSAGTPSVAAARAVTA